MRWPTTIVVLVQIAGSFCSASDQPEGQVVFSPHLVDGNSLFNLSVHAVEPRAARGVGADDRRLELLCSMLVRAYDPCISCAVH